MQIVIDIPDGYVKVIKANQRTEGSAMDKMIRQAVIDGTPLPKGHGALEEEPVLDKIRAEIETKIGEYNNRNDYLDFCSGLICARKIIDKYLAEMEKSRSKGKRKEREG